jgi:hypothetical protein
VKVKRGEFVRGFLDLRAVAEGGFQRKKIVDEGRDFVVLHASEERVRVAHVLHQGLESECVLECDGQRRVFLDAAGPQELGDVLDGGGEGQLPLLFGGARSARAAFGDGQIQDWDRG